MTRRRLIATVVVVVAAVLARIALTALTFAPGWSALTWDDFTRVAIARSWAESPFLVDSLVWLPLPFWMTGTVYAVFGDAFLTNPMVLMAAINTAAIVAAAAVTGWAGWRLARSVSGGMIAFLAILFSPWGLFAGNSGLAEALYYLAISVTAAAAVAWVKGRHHPALAIGSVAVASAAAMRYEGWWLAAAWLGCVVADGWWRNRERGLRRSLTTSFPSAAIAAAPLLVPVWWMWINYRRTGSPLFFARESAATFLGAYGADLFDSIPERLLYYPAALVRSAPLLLLAIAVMSALAWHRREVRGLVVLFAAQLAMFYATSLLSPAVGAFPERFMFGFAIGVAPIIGTLPDVVGRVRPRPRRIGFAVGLAVIAVTVTAFRMADRPQEWTHAPDLLAVSEAIATLPQDRVAVVSGPGMENDAIPLAVQNGSAVALTVSAGSPVSDGLWLERLPARTAEFTSEQRQIGRFSLYGALAAEITAAPCMGCDGWTYQDENGVQRPVRASRFVGMEFMGDDPPPGSRASLLNTIPPSPQARRATIDIRWLYGHGFNSGRIDVEVVVGDDIVFTTDIAAHSRWTEVRFDVPAGSDPVPLRVSVIAQEGIETGWAWGRVSTVLIRRFEVSE